MVREKNIKAVAIMFLLVMLPNVSQAEKQTGGAIIGGIIGAVTGSQIGSGHGKTAAIAVGTLLGANIGSEVGKSLDRADKFAIKRTTSRTLETNKDYEKSTWDNPNNNHHGSVVPTNTYYNNGIPCRKFKTTIVIDGNIEKATGTACRKNGEWQIQ